MQFSYKITLQGTKPGDKTTLVFDLGDFAEPVDYAAVLNAANQIRGALVDITDANVAKETVTGVVSEDNNLPADADTTDEAAIVVHLNVANTAEKLHTLRVPAPIDALFQPGGETVDLTNADLVQYIQQVAQHAYVSDGEQIQTGSGTDGMKRGYWRSRAKVLTGQ